MNLFPSDRRTRRPKHNFATESHVWEIQPILVAPVLPGVTLYTSTFMFAECYIFNKQSQLPIFCNPFMLRCSLHTNRAHLLPKLRCQFAEYRDWEADATGTAISPLTEVIQPADDCQNFSEL